VKKPDPVRGSGILSVFRHLWKKSSKALGRKALLDFEILGKIVVK
jgi:hypothetical protein